MHCKSSISSLGILGLSILFASPFACSQADNDVGSLGGSGGGTDTGSGGSTQVQCTYEGSSYSVGASIATGCGNTCMCGPNGTLVNCTLKLCPATGGAIGSGTGGSAGGAIGTGGATGTGICTYKGTTYTVGDTFKDDCNTCRCGAETAPYVSCTLMACLGTGGSTGGGGSTGTPIDGGSLSEAGPATSSACANCGADELCVAYYDGTCTPMGSTCNKVSAATRDAILIGRQRCFATAMGDEICGTRDGQHFWGCGEPVCASQPTLSDINCYGP